MLKKWLWISSPSVGKVVKQQYDSFTFIMAFCHCICIYTRIPFIPKCLIWRAHRNTDNFVYHIKIRNARCKIIFVQIITVIRISMLVASLLWPVLSLSQQSSNLTIFFLCAAYLICFDPVGHTLAPLFFAFRIPHGLPSYVKGGLWSLWWDCFWSEGSDMIWALISLWSH